MTALAGTETRPERGDLRRLAEFVGVPRALNRLEVRIERAEEVLAEVSDSLARTAKASERTARDFENVEAELAKLRETLVALVDKNDCLERASQQQTTLTEEHFSAHVVDPIAATLFELIDFCSEMGKALEDSNQADVLRVFSSKVRGVLEGFGIRPIDVEVGEPVDTQCMKIVSYHKTCPNAHADGTVAHIRKQGFRRGRRILRPAEVDLHRFEAFEGGVHRIPATSSKGA